MNVHFAVPRRKWPARLTTLGVVLLVIAVAAATFVLSYSGVHAVALQAGVQVDLARLYPPILDAVLVIACAAAPALREARWWTRCYAWLAILLVAAVIGTIDAIHAIDLSISHRVLAGVASVLPWALLLLSFSLWLTILRHFRAQHVAPALYAREPALVTLPPPDPLRATEGGPALAPEAESPEAEAQDAEAPDAEAAIPGAAAPSAHGSEPVLDGEGGDSIDAPQSAVADPMQGVVPEALATPEVPAVPISTGPRLRRVRSLPAPPVDEDE